MTEPIRVSWSMIRAHADCRQKTALLRQGKRAKAGDLRGYFHGMVVDSVMRAWLADPNRAHLDMRAMVEEHIDRGQREAVASGDGVVRWRGPGDRDALRQFSIDLVGRLEPILDELVLPHTYLSGHRFSHPITLPDGTYITLVGEMDLLVHDPVGWAVWDLKGTKDDSYWRKVVGQLVFYDLATKLEHGEHPYVSGLIQPMCKQPVLRFDFDADDRRAMLTRILQYVSDVQAGRDDCRSDTAGCTRCDVSHACPRYLPQPGRNTLSLSASLRQAATESLT